MTTLKGLILQETDRGESSKSICVLTAEKGLIYVFIRGGRKSTKNSSSTQMFGYSKLCLEEKKDAKGQVSYYLNSSEPVKLFYNIRLDAKRVALAAYFAELLKYSGVESSDNGDVMRLALNTFYYLNEGSRDMELLRSIFELRLLCDIGMQPRLIGCFRCYKPEDKRMHYNFRTRALECDSCCANPDSIFDTVLEPSVLYTIRYIALSDMEKLFSFRISERCQRKLTAFTERFVKFELKSDLKTLDFYKML